MSGKTNSVSATKNQPAIDHRLANELTEKILGHLRLAARYADIADQHAEIHDNFAFDRSVESFVSHARDASAALKNLRKARGVTD